MQTLSCPSCGASVNFHSKASVFAVCSFCQSSIVKQDMNLQLLGKVSELQDDMSPIQIGSKGIYQGKDFEVIGRIKVKYFGGTWNEWYTIFADGRTGWLAEAQGFWAMCFSVPDSDAAQIPKITTIQTGTLVLLKPYGDFEVEDIHDVVCQFSEGELPVNAVEGRKAKSVDLTRGDDQMATIEYAADCVRVFVGKYQNFDAFKFSNLRELPGWTLDGKVSKKEITTAEPAKGKVKTFSCKNCGASVTLRNPDSLSVACDSCHSLIDCSDDSFRILHSYRGKTQLFNTRGIELGSHLHLFDKTWEVLGFSVRQDTTTRFMWEEFLLFNPFYGYRWLTLSDGHWSFVVPIKEKPDLQSGHRMRFQGKDFRLFDRGTVITIFVIGEFYWRVVQDVGVQMDDFICPPEMLSREHDRHEVNWSIGTYVPPAVVKKAAKAENPEFYLPSHLGIAPNQPCSNTAVFKSVGAWWFIFFVVLTLMQYWQVTNCSNALVLNRSFQFPPNAKSKASTTTPVFELSKEAAPVSIKIIAPVDNSWFYLDGELVNNDTGVSYPFDRSVEYYHGADSDGPWSEGSNEASVTVSAVPAGKYYINFDTESGGGKNFVLRTDADTNRTRYYEAGPDDIIEPQLFSLLVWRDTPTYGNYFWCLFFLSITPCLYWFLSTADETARWSKSDYSPYTSSS